MTLIKLQGILDNHGMYTTSDGIKITIYDKNDNIIDTVEIVSSKDNKTTIKTSEYDSILLMEWLGY